MMVEEGEEVAACRLLQCLYTACLPDIETEVDLRVYLGILMLADQYQVEAALSLCAQKLEMLKDLGAISWELADRVMQLPAGYLEKPGISCLVLKVQVRRARPTSTWTFAVGLFFFASAWISAYEMLGGKGLYSI